MQEFKGIPVSPGIAIARCFVLDDARELVPLRRIEASEVEREIARAGEAIDASLGELQDLHDQAKTTLSSDAAAIFAFHQTMLRDPAVVEPIGAMIRAQHVNAEYAVQEQFAAVADMFQRMPDPTFRTKVDDVWDLEKRVIRQLIGEHQAGLDRLEHDAIIVAPDLTPTQASAFDRSRIHAFATDTGGQTSHTAIFARALGIPAVVGVGGLSRAAREGDMLIIDGDSGVVVLDPDETTIERYEMRRRDVRAIEEDLTSLRELPAVTRDGSTIELLGNVEFGNETERVLRFGGVGVGLFRTEYLWLTRDHDPTEDEQYREYTRAVELANGYPVTLRTFDLGADKATQSRFDRPERNPFLGARSIRYCFEHPEMFKTQLRAVLRASAHGPVKVMFPLIGSVGELRKARLMLNEVMEDLEDEGVPFDPNIPVGMMIEVPSAAVMASAFAREVDFFSIGTNDLVQYTLAVDRTNERVADLYSAAHPAVIRLIKDVVRAAKRRHVPVSLCGETAGELVQSLLLIGIGLRTLSVTPSRIPYLKKAIRTVDIAHCERLARTAGTFDSEQQVTAYLRDQARRLFPELLDGRSDA
ncbi:MAG: phosphoenolpyruvate--protein phosphotransferase [Phycisphaerales bacterium]